MIQRPFLLIGITIDQTAFAFSGHSALRLLWFLVLDDIFYTTYLRSQPYKQVDSFILQHSVRSEFHLIDEVVRTRENILSTVVSFSSTFHTKVRLVMWWDSKTTCIYKNKNLSVCVYFSFAVIESTSCNYSLHQYKGQGLVVSLRCLFKISLGHGLVVWIVKVSKWVY